MRYIGLLFLSLTICSLAYSETNSSKRVNLFKDAVEAISAAGDAIESLTDSIAHLVKTGNDGYDFIAATREYNKLKDLSARSTNLVNLKQVVVVKSIDEYLAIDEPTNYQWDSLIQGIHSKKTSRADGASSSIRNVSTFSNLYMRSMRDTHKAIRD